MIGRRQFLAATAAAVAMPAYLRQAWAQNPEVELKLHHFLGPKAPAHTKMLEPWAKAIQDDSSGRVKIELPTVFTNDIVSANLAMRDLFESQLAPEYADVHVLFLHVHAGQAIHMASKLVRTPDDTKGLKLRVPGPTGNAVVEAMGATPVTMPVPDLPQALSTNAVDGALIPWEIIPPLQLFESTKYQIEGPDNNRFGTTTFQVSMNKARWEALPDDLKEVFTKHSGEDWLREVANIWRGSDDFGIKMAVDKGNEHIVLTEDEMKAFNTVLAPVVDRWVEEQKGNFDAAALVEAARGALAARKS